MKANNLVNFSAGVLPGTQESEFDEIPSKKITE